MSTKKDGYVRRINCTCYRELSQSLKIKYFMAVDENVARSCELFPFLSRFTVEALQCHHSHKMICLRAIRKL